MLLAFVLKDLKGSNYGMPRFMRSAQDLRRDLAQQLVRDPDSLAAQFPGDYDIYCIGEWDETSGQFKSYPDMEHVCSMSEIFQLAQAIAKQSLTLKGGVK